MLNIDATDKIEGIASVADKVEFTCSVVDGTTVKSSEGLLSNSQTQIYLATAATRILSLTLVNTHTSAVTVNVQKDPTDAGTLYRIIPKDLSLGIGYMLLFDGQRCTVLDASGRILKGYDLHASEHENAGADEISVTGLSGLLADGQHIVSAPGTIGKLELDHNVETLAANKTLVITDKVIQKLDPDGTDRNILLPAENTATDLVFFIYNMGGELGEDLNIQDDAAAALLTVGYNQLGLCTCDGTTWKVLCIACANGANVVSLRVKEENTSALVVGQPVYVSGATGAAFPNVGLADCNDSTKIRVKGLAAEAISQNSTGYIRTQGLLEGVDSTKGGSVNPLSQDWTAGDQLYISTTAGGLTNVRPIGRSIKAGTALTAEGSNSKILVDIRENSIYTGAASGENIIHQMGDSAGANKVSYQDYAGNEVASINSNGVFTGKIIKKAKGGDIASASPLVIDTDGDYFDVTGTTGFAAMTVAANRHFFLQFDGILTMTHHAANLDLPGEANITTAAGDVGEFFSTGANTVQCVNFCPAVGSARAGINADITSMTGLDNDGIPLAKVANAASDGANSDITSLSALSGQQTIPTINLTGGQIAFPATAVPSADANTLDDYEEGTAELGITCGSGTAAFVAGYQDVKYTKNGRSADISGRMAIGVISSPAGALMFTGIPFANGSGNYSTTGIFLAGIGLTGGAGATPLQGYIVSSATTINISRLLAGVNTDDIADFLVQNISEIRIGGTYSV